MRSKDDAAKLAGSLLRRLDSGASFDELVRQNSDDRATTSVGGRFGSFRPGTLDPTLERAIAEAPIGGYTITETKFGFHVIERQR